MYGYVVAVRGRDYRAILGPVHEGVACVGHGQQGTDVTIGIATATGYRTAGGWVGARRDGVGVEGKVGDIGCVFGHRKGIRSAR